LKDPIAFEFSLDLLRLLLRGRRHQKESCGAIFNLICLCEIVEHVFFLLHLSKLSGIVLNAGKKEKLLI
jgi:hypothetical protein